MTDNTKRLFPGTSRLHQPGRTPVVYVRPELVRLDDKDVWGNKLSPYSIEGGIGRRTWGPS